MAGFLKISAVLWLGFYFCIKSSFCLDIFVDSESIDAAVIEYFESKTIFLNVRIQLNSKLSQKWEPEILARLTHVLKNSTQLTYCITLNKEMLERSPFNHNLWYVDSYAAVKSILPPTDERFGNSNGSYVIFLKLTQTLKNNNNYMAEIQRIFGIMFKYNIVNVIVIIRKDKHRILVYGFQPFRPKLCRNTEPILVNSFDGTKFIHPELFPHKLKNFQNCTIRIFPRNVAPFFIYNEKSRGSSEFYGIEAEILKAIARKLNFHIELYGESEQFWGDIYPNGTLTGPFLLLQNHHVDMLIGYFSYSYRRVQQFSESVSYLPSPMIAVVRKVSSEAAVSSKWLLDPFQWCTWLGLLVYIVLTMAFMKLTNICTFTAAPTTASSCLNLFGYVLGLAQPVARARSSMRFSITIWCLGYTAFNIAYQGKLFDAYNHMAPRTPLSIADLNRQNYTFLLRTASDLSVALYSLNVPMQRIRTLTTNDAALTYELVRNSTARMATITSYLRILFYVRNRQAYDSFELLPETVRLQQMCAYFRRQSFLLRPVNDIIGVLRQSGWIYKWYGDLDYKNAILEQQSKVAQVVNYPEPLGIVRFKILILGFLFLHMLAFSIFTIELCAYFYSLKKLEVKMRIQRNPKNKIGVKIRKKSV